MFMIWSLLAEFSCKSMFLNWDKTLLVGEEIHLAAKSGVKCSSDPSTSKQEQTEEKSIKLTFDLSVACGSIFHLNYRFSTSLVFILSVFIWDLQCKSHFNRKMVFRVTKSQSIKDKTIIYLI